MPLLLIFEQLRQFLIQTNINAKFMLYSPLLISKIYYVVLLKLYWFVCVYIYKIYMNKLWTFPIFSEQIFHLIIIVYKCFHTK